VAVNTSIRFGFHSVVWDVGSNLGLFALPAALKAARGQVYAFEPDVDLASLDTEEARVSAAPLR
jgi:FkbM family methyltransferase